MEECFVVEVENNDFATGVSVIDENYENLEIVRVFPAGFLSQDDPVDKENELHPLEAEIRLDARRQNQCTRLATVIQALPVQENESPTPSISGENDCSQNTQEERITTNSNDDNITLSTAECLPLLVDPQKNKDTLDLSQIPITVQICSEVGGDDTVSRNEIPDSGSDDESFDIRPICDGEPDPDLPGEALDAAITDMNNRCYMCFKRFRQKKNMYAHIRKIHSTQPQIIGGIICPLCKMTVLRQEHLRNHLQALHRIKIEKEEKRFSFLSEFLVWKHRIEEETSSHFVSKSSAKVLSFNQTKTYFKCHRSGFSENSKKQGKKKKLGSSKIGATCPAAMELTETATEVTVTYWSTHVGHDLYNLLPKRPQTLRDFKITNTDNTELDWVHYLAKSDLSLDQEPSILHTVSNSLLYSNSEQDSQPTDFFVSRSLEKLPRKRNPKKPVSRAVVIEKVNDLLRLVKTTDIYSEFRPQVCLMIDNLMSTITRRSARKRRKTTIRGPRKRILKSAQELSGCSVPEIIGNQEPDVLQPKKST